MKKIVFITLLSLLPLCGLSQHEPSKWTIQPKAGLNIADIANVDNTTPLLGFAIGVEAERQISNQLSLSAAAVYSVQGANSDFVYQNVKGEENLRFNCLNFPVVANYYVTQGFALKAGIQLGFNISSRYKIKAADGSSLSGSLESITGQEANTMYLSIPLGISYEYRSFVIDGRYNWGLTRIASGDAQHSVFQITLGYKFAL